MARDEFARRRRQLMRLMGRDSIAVLPAAPVRHRNSDVEYPYRQDSDFHYLTGFRGAYADFDQRVVGWVNALRPQARNGRHPPQEFGALDHVLHDMRLYKSRHELTLLRSSARIAAGAHQRAMRFCRPGATEYQVMAE